MKIWPENDPKRQSFLNRLCDSLFYPYMGEILDKGSKLHKERMNYTAISDSTHSEDGNDKNKTPAAGLKEISKEDIFQAPEHMHADILQERFRDLFEKKHKEMLEKQSKKKKKTVNDIKIAKKARRWALLHVLWNISKPTYIYAAFYQLVTVLVQSLNPIAVQYMLRLLEKYPNQNIFTKGIGFAIALFVCSVVESIAQERHKFLSFQSGILIRAATVSSIYHHMLNLTSKGKQHLLTGETTNLVAIDCQKLFEVCQEGHLIWSCPLSMIIVMILLLITLGPSTLVGMMSMFLLVPLVKKVVGRMMVIRRKRAIHTDKRVDTTTSMLQAIKFCKLNHYEEKFLKRVHNARREEMVWVRKELSYIGLTMAMTVLTPVIACALTFITFVLTNENNTLSASDTFTTLLLFSVLRFPINYAGKLMGKAAQGLEACQRIADFFHRDSSPNAKISEEGLDESATDILPLIEVNNASFTVGEYLDEIDMDKNIAKSDPESTSKASFTVSGINFEVRKSETLAIVGPVGSGKSTLLHALIGDVPSNPDDINIRGSVAYASQTPFILNATVRDNILFGKEYNKELYDKVIEASNLLPDLKQLGPSRDLTEIGERGVTLSGGQKARISIARCVYAQPTVALFDDVLSALDAATGKFIFDRLFDSSEGKETLLSESAVILVTHAAHFLSRVDKIMVLVKGKSVFTGTWSSLLTAKSIDVGANEVLKSLCSSVQETGDAEEMVVIRKGANLVNIEEHKDAEHGTIMSEEERDFGLSNWRTWIKWYKYAGGITFTFLTALALTVDRGFYVANEWWLASWTKAEFEPIRRFGKTFSPQVDGMSAQQEFIKYYVIILLISFVGAVLRSQWIIQGGGRCSEKLFNEMTTRVIRAPMSYFETTPMGRILNRLTYDVEILDISLSQSMTVLMTASGWFVTGLILQITILPWNVFMLVPIIVVYWLLLLYYRKSAVDLQRLDAISRSPVQADLAEGIDGSSTIKVFGQIEYFEKQFKHALDENTSAMMNFMAAQRWLGVRFQILGSFAVLFGSVFVVSYNNKLKIETGLIAMLIIWASHFTITLGFFSQAVSESEAYLTSVERARDMAELPQESSFETMEGEKPNPDWPLHGRLSFEDVCLRYRPGLALALKGLTFTAEPGQRVGICGRTGAGKSTIAVALFRLAELESGRIVLDGQDLSKLGLGDVRGRKNGMAIIPQDPVLFSGSLRECLDPWGQSTDTEILDALITVKVADAEHRGMQALDDYVDEGGRNFSVGERQLLCLARAVLSKPKVLVLDEATASVDAETDAFIQRMIRQRFKGTTLLTIAHRLNTIMDYDVVLVMDKGKVAEFGRPDVLLENPDGLFTGLVNSTGRESSMALRRMSQQNLRILSSSSSDDA
mmetsp:Transcript_13592/g.25525  ORF Transcript_13592/g.25525 Transcript_13592/m.25525 type:complete len:1381 (-) Transcript_13592:42-4184(-)